MILNDEGVDYFDQADYQKAIEKYQEAIDVDANDALIHSNLALAWENLTTPGSRVEHLEHAIVALQKALDLKPDEHEYVERLTKLQRKWRIGEHFGETAIDIRSEVTPIAVEIASNLIPYVASETEGLQPDLNDQIVEMRERIQETRGVRVPGILFRGNEGDLPEGSYVIMINEIPFVMGTIAENKRLFPGPLENLRALGISGEETVNPQTGDEAVWISEADWPKVENAGLELWEVIDYMVRHIEDVIRKNLSEFLGHQEVMNMLQEAQLLDIYQQMKNVPADLSALTSVLKGLLNEEVPITAFEKIIEKFNPLKQDGENLLTIVERIRSMPEIRPKLPGNDGQYAFYQFSQEFEAEVDKSIHNKDTQPILAMGPEPYQEVLGAVRGEIGSQRYVALVVETAVLRPLVRKLIELEWPSVPVLSRMELLPGFENKVLGTIELKQSGGV